MNKVVASVLGIIGLALTFIPSILVFLGTLSFELHKTMMLIGFLFWFIAGPFWVSRK